jgi:hypothetical protein
MSTINLYEAYQQKTRKFGVTSTATRFRDSFVEAVNQVYAEINSEVFQNQTIEYINSFNDIIDTRLVSFTNMTFDVGADAAIDNREFWGIEYDLERTSSTNGLTDTIDDSNSNVVISIVNGVLSVTGNTVTGTLTLPTLDTYRIRFESNKDGNRVLVNGDEYSLEYTVGDSETSQAIGTVNSHVISGVSGWEFKRTRFLTAGTLVYEFNMDEETTNTNVTDIVAGYEATLTGVQWDERWVEPSSGLDSQYRSVFDIGLDYHLQDGGEWAIESEASRYQKWYGDPSTKQKGGIQMARNIYQINTTYTSPLGI